MTMRLALAALLLPALAAAAPPGALTTSAAVEAAIATSVTAGRPMVLEFTADWCAGCRELEASFRDPAVQSRLGCADRIVVDLTNRRDPRATELTQRFALAGLPTVAFFDAEGTERGDLRLTGAASANRLAGRVARAC